MGPPRSQRAGPWPVQLRHQTWLTSEQYVSERGWLQASLNQCPVHGKGGCRFSRHGTYARVEPPGMQVARWYCRDAHRTFSMLPDCMSSRLTGSLDEAEQVVVRVEESPSVEKAAQKLRPDLELAGALRWVRRRVRGVHASLWILLTLLPGRLGSTARLVEVRTLLSTQRCLVMLRAVGAAHLHALPRPLGFRPLGARTSKREERLQHKTGPDPPRHSR